MSEIPPALETPSGLEQAVYSVVIAREVSSSAVVADQLTHPGTTQAGAPYRGVDYRMDAGGL